MSKIDRMMGKEMETLDDLHEGLFDMKKALTRRDFLKRASLTSTLLLAAGIASKYKSPIPVLHAHSGDIFDVGLAQTIPVIDGLENIAGEEWGKKDTNEMKLSDEVGAGEAYVRAKITGTSDNDFLYSHVDDLSSTRFENPFYVAPYVAFFFDTMNNGYNIKALAPDDFSIQLFPLPDGSVVVPIKPSGSSEIPYVNEIKARCGLGPSSHSDKNHLQYEAAIPMKTLKKYPDEKEPNKVRFSVSLITDQGSVLYYPVKTLADMVFLDYTIPEFSSASKMLLIALGAGAALAYLSHHASHDKY